VNREQAPLHPTRAAFEALFNPERGLRRAGRQDTPAPKAERRTYQEDLTLLLSPMGFELVFKISSQRPLSYSKV
jgi:hypothetical protein